MGPDAAISAARDFERRLDEYRISLPVFAYPINSIQWHLLIAHEEETSRRATDNPDPFAMKSSADELKKGLRHALDWTYSFGAPSTTSFMATRVDTRLLGLSRELLFLGCTYQLIYISFSLLRRSLVQVEQCEGNQIRFATNRDMIKYDFLSFQQDELLSMRRLRKSLHSSTTQESFISSLQSVLASARVDHNGRLHIPENIDALKIIKAVISEEYEEQLHVPDQWQLGGMSGTQIRATLMSLRALMLVHALIIHEFSSEAALCPSSFVWTGTRSRLARSILRIGGVDKRADAFQLIDLLTYQRQCYRPDPALQPIFVASDNLLIPPRLIEHSNLGRNLLALVAKLQPREYDAMSSVFHDALVDDIARAFKRRGFVCAACVKIPARQDLGDIDILAFDPSLRQLLIIEAKAVIAPGEPGEELSRADTEDKAIKQQILPRLEYAKSNHQTLLRLLGIEDATVAIDAVVAFLVMRGFHGFCRQNEHIPTVEADFLLSELESPKSNAELVDWIASRHFIPAEGHDYRIQPETLRFGPFDITIDMFYELT